MRPLTMRVAKFCGVILVVVFNASAHAAAPLSCSVPNPPQKPFQLFGNSYYVGGHGLSSILITSDEGDILIDGDLPQSPSVIAANVVALGFKIEDIKLILNSHAHCDHAGGISELQKMSGAEVAASPSSANVLRSGRPGKDDPQHDTMPEMTPVARVKTIMDKETLHVGSIAVTAHFTPGHTSGGTTWTWDSCEKNRCLHMVYADSLTAVSAKGFRFGSNISYPNVLVDFEKSFTVLNTLPCDVLLLPHPEASQLWDRLQKRDAGNQEALIDRAACKNYAMAGRSGLERRIEQENSSAPGN